MAEVRWLELNGARQQLALFGPPRAPLLLYLHGGPGAAELPFAERFAAPLAERFRVAVWDQRGAGASRDTPVGVEGLIADLRALVARLRAEHDPPKLVLVGHSWGGLLGLLALERDPALADGFVGIGQLVAGLENERESHRLATERALARGWPLLARLLALEPPPYGARGGALLRKTAYLWLLGGVVRRRALAWGMLGQLLGFRGYRARDKLLYLARFARSAARLQPEIERLDLLALEPGAQRPVLLCAGCRDLVTPPRLSRALCERLAPRAELKTFADAAHSLHYEAPAAFAAALEAWYAREIGPLPMPALERSRALVMRHGWNATAYQTLNPGLRFWFSARPEAVVAYVRHAGVRVVAGAPVCAAEALAEVAARFEAEARSAGERVCYFGADARLARLYRGARATPHHATVVLGAQPVWDPQRWAALIARERSVRAQLRRARNKGVTVRAWEGEPELGALRGMVTAWLARKPLPSLHFLTEPDLLGRLDDRRLLVAWREDEPVGFLLASPVPARRGWLVEQLIRSEAAPNGTSECLIDAAMRALSAEGSRYLSLGLAPLSQRAAAPDRADPLWLRLTLRLLRAHGQRFYNFGGLEYFKAKLKPERWDPIYAIATERAFSPRTLYAIAAAFSGGSPALLVARALAGAARRELRGLLRHE